ncbi:MAG: sigma-54-dependent transcriptional regulator [Isosphaeraceae bacterium]
MRKFRILIVCPDPQGLSLLTSMLRSLGHLIEEAATDRVAVRLMEHNPINLVLASVDPGDAEALELLTYVRRKYPAVPVVLMFPRVHPERAKEALRLGALAVLKYPVPAAELRAAVLQALEQCATEPVEAAAAGGPILAFHVPATAVRGATPALSQVVSSSNHMRQSNGSFPAPTISGRTIADPVDDSSLPASANHFDVAISPVAPAATWSHDVDLITGDAGLRQLAELAAELANVSAPVFIVGEPGTGKTLLAKLLHVGKGQFDRPFATLKAADLAETESETDESDPPTPNPATAQSEWANKLAQARGGTLYIEEVGALPAEIQLQLLRELQLQDIESAAGHGRLPGRPGVRFILSTSENLAAAVDQGRFRPELYHRIGGLCLMVPPLRHRGGDVELLAEYFRSAFAQEFHKEVVGFTRDALEALQRHDWPGNVRELKGVIQRAVARCTSPRLTSSHLTPILNLQRQSRTAPASNSRPHVPMGVRPLKEALEEPEKRIIIQALQAFNWNRQETARVLDINRTTLYKKMKKYGLLMDEPMWIG